MSNSILEQAYQLTQGGEPFVLATVVWCEAPTSAKPGAQALVRANGEMTGWIGGSCAQPVVLREAARLLREGGDPYLLRLGASETSIPHSGVRNFPMSCTSGGVLDIYMEPHLPQPQLVLVGDSPVIVVNEQTYILVATHGQYDEDALEQALRSPACYVGMVGSRKRAETCRAYLRSSGLTAAQIARLRIPAGLDLGAVTPDEIAASILAELVQVRRRGSTVEKRSDQISISEPAAENTVTSAAPGTAIDPVCGMEVEIATAMHHTTLEGRDFYFCCPACKRLFERNPQEYLVQRAE